MALRNKALPCDDLSSTPTLNAQRKVEEEILSNYQAFLQQHGSSAEAGSGDGAPIPAPTFDVSNMKAFLRNSMFRPMSSAFSSLDGSRAWITFWCTQAGALANITNFDARSIMDFLRLSQHPDGGFGGGPGLLAHLAPTYAAVATLVNLNREGVFEDDEPLRLIDRESLYRWLMSLKTPEGSFAVHHDGECDVRGSYLALSVAQMTNILTPELLEGAVDWIAQCQTYEGGLAGRPGLEAHGGYTYCGVAALACVGAIGALDIDALTYWALQRQMSLEGGFQGRTNKLVDSCYSFWCGAVLALLSGTTRSVMAAETSASLASHMDPILFDRASLLDYLFVQCYDASGGGFKDKPSSRLDAYHTCYSLSGVSVAHSVDDLPSQSGLERPLAFDPVKVPPFLQHVTGDGAGTGATPFKYPVIYRGRSRDLALLSSTNAIFNIERNQCRKGLEFFRSLGNPMM
ncbi:hypothetical protein H696_05025 [Fonticula alba]|uniref:Protein farnesyltransferase subunit beta n=1 Tax=Fonticula alba TaxID=691883 RepID=A0A058Z366_FONAL|nr:hypothetical protein H696_05025 [Fonticula alba]KCV68739.1 hypothetical protein H696_05025 [Fonticula alba]|eukprot:XP_009497171.1 hypothetical protein H696_05025 [Fonticula alba]